MSVVVVFNSTIGASADRDGLTFTGDQKLIPTLDEYRARNGGNFPKVIWDIALQHKGTITYAFEVVWKSDISVRKHAIIKDSTVTVYTVSAMWVLKQTSPPATIMVDSRIEPWDA